MNNQWYDAGQTLPPLDTPTIVMVQEVCGGSLRNRYHLEIAYTTRNMCFKEYWSTKSGIARYWQAINFPNDFKKIPSTEIFELEAKYEQN